MLVNNAGTGHSTPVLDLDLDTFNAVVANDLTGPFLNAQVAARHVVQQGHRGRITKITSVHEHLPRYGATAYGTAKAGLTVSGSKNGSSWDHRKRSCMPRRSARSSCWQASCNAAWRLMNHLASWPRVVSPTAGGRWSLSSTSSATAA